MRYVFIHVIKNRGDRLFRKVQIRKRLVDRAIRSYNRNMAGAHCDGSYAERISETKELPKSDYYRIGRILRNEGKNRARVYKCGSSACEWCVGNLTHKNNCRSAAMDAELSAWANDEHLPFGSDMLWENNKRWQIAVAKVLALITRLSE